MLPEDTVEIAARFFSQHLSQGHVPEQHALAAVWHAAHPG